MADSIFKQMGNLVGEKLTALQTAISDRYTKAEVDTLMEDVVVNSNGMNNVYTLGAAIDRNDVGTWIPGWDEHPTYSRVHQYTKGQFAISSNSFDNKVLHEVAMRIAPFQVNQTTGMMTWGTIGFGYHNTVGDAHSTQSFGFCGNIGMAWGNSEWGSDNTHRQGGCWWRVNDNNTVTQGSNTGNIAYTRSENTSNGMLALGEYNGNTFFHIPTSDGASKARANGGYVITSNAQLGALPSIDGGWNPNSTTSTCYIWRCIGKTVGVNKIGVFNYFDSSGNPKAIALSATGYNSVSGSAISANSVDRSGIGFELENGEQLYLTTGCGTFVRTSETGGIVSANVTNIGEGASTLSKYVIPTNSSYWTGGYPAKETDTFYIIDNGYYYHKVRFNKVSSYNYTYEILGYIDLNPTRMNIDLISYDGLVDVTGTNDDFILVSGRYTSYQPSVTLTFHNPLKDL